MNLTASIQITEIVWLLFVLPGLILWLVNFNQSLRNLRSVRRARLRNGRLIYARSAVAVTGLLFYIELAFAVIGIVAMTLVPGPNSTLATGIFIAAVFITCSVGATLAGFLWRKADYEILRRAEARLAPPVDADPLIG